MNEKTYLPLIQPLYSTYHFQGSGCAIIGKNPSIKNWYLNNSIQLECNRAFIAAYSSPVISVKNSSFKDNPFLNKQLFSMQELGENIHDAIRQLIDSGNYIFFDGIDDFYMEGKSWSGERHVLHDGLIHGYDLNEHTYDIYAYNKMWQYKSFNIGIDVFEEARQKTFREYCGFITAIGVSKDEALIDIPTICNELNKYINSDFSEFPPYINENAYGTVVHDYIATYMYKYLNGAIPYEKLDRRVFRMLWEHKTVMLERIRIVEKELGFNATYSNAYENISKRANDLRLMYASHMLKRRDEILKTILNEILELKSKEQEILNGFLIGIKP